MIPGEQAALPSVAETLLNQGGSPLRNEGRPRAVCCSGMVFPVDPVNSWTCPLDHLSLTAVTVWGHTAAIFRLPRVF